MKELGPVRFRDFGDRRQAELLHSLGRKLLGDMKQEMDAFGVKFLKRQFQLDSGVVFVISTNRIGLADIDEIQVYMPPMRISAKSDSDITIYGFIVKAFMNDYEKDFQYYQLDVNITDPSGFLLGEIDENIYKFDKYKGIKLVSDYRVTIEDADTLSQEDNPIVHEYPFNGFPDNGAKVIPIFNSDTLENTEYQSIFACHFTSSLVVEFNLIDPETNEHTGEIFTSYDEDGLYADTFKSGFRTFDLEEGASAKSGQLSMKEIYTAQEHDTGLITYSGIELSENGFSFTSPDNLNASVNNGRVCAMVFDMGAESQQLFYSDAAENQMFPDSTGVLTGEDGLGIADRPPYDPFSGVQISKAEFFAKASHFGVDTSVTAGEYEVRVYGRGVEFVPDSSIQPYTYFKQCNVEVMLLTSDGYKSVFIELQRDEILGRTSANTSNNSLISSDEMNFDAIYVNVGATVPKDEINSVVYTREIVTS